MRKFCPSLPFRQRAGTLARVSLIAVLGLWCAPVTRAQTDDPHYSERGERADIWRAVLDRMPEGWRRARRVEVRWVSDREMERLISEQEDEDNSRGDNSTIQGFYDRAPDNRSPASITIRASLGRQEATFVLTHEYAHMVWDEVLTRRGRSDYRQVWEDQRSSRRLVSRYAGESPEEGFAEAVASYLLQNERLKRRDEASYDFVAGVLRDADRKAETRELERH